MGWGGWVEKREGEMKKIITEKLFHKIWNAYYGGLERNQESIESWVKDPNYLAIGAIATTVL